MKKNRTPLLLCLAGFFGLAVLSTPTAFGQGKLAKIDLDGDFNYDGQILNDDPTDNGAVQVTPPGLVLGLGEVTKLGLRIKPYREDWLGEAALILEVAGINRARESGEFESLEEEMDNMGHVLIYADPGLTQLLIDSRNPEMRRYVWTADSINSPATMSKDGKTLITMGGLPSMFFVQGVGVSKAEGDVRVLVKIESRRTAFQTFATTFDHNLITVAPQPHPKMTDTAVWWGTPAPPIVRDGK